MPPEPPHPDVAELPQHWNDALRGAVELQTDAALTTAVALELNAPATFLTMQRVGVVPEEMGAEGLDRHPVGMTDPTPTTDSMAPVDAALAAQDFMPADLRSSPSPSAAPPQRLAAVLQAAGYGGGVSTVNRAEVRSTATEGGSVPDAAAATPSAASDRFMSGVADPSLPTDVAPARLDERAIANLSLPFASAGPTRGEPAAAQRAAADPVRPGTGGRVDAVAGSITRPASQAPQPSAPQASQRAAADQVRPGTGDRADPAAGSIARPASQAPLQAAPQAPQPSALYAPAAHANQMDATVGAFAAASWASTVLAPSVQTSGPTLGSPAAAWSRQADGAASDGELVAYTERRALPIDLAPFAAVVPIWRLDDTQALVAVGPEGARASAMRAAELYRAIMDNRAGLAAIGPDEGFITWEGSPLWLSLAGIEKPAGLGILAAAAPPARVQVMRNASGEWLVEHSGGLWRAPRTLRHHASADDDEALLLDVLFGVRQAAPDVEMLRRYERARAAVRFAGGRRDPVGWRAQEAWAMVARACAAAAMQPDPDRPATGRDAVQAALAAVMDGAVSGLRGLGRSVLERVRLGIIDGLGTVEAVALAACLGRLVRHGLQVLEDGHVSNHA